MKMKHLLVLLRDIRSKYSTEVETLKSSLESEMDEKLYNNVDVYGIKGKDESDDEDRMPILDVIEALTRKTRAHDMTKPMREDYEALSELLSKMEQKIRIGLDDRRAAKEALKGKTDILFKSAEQELNELVDFSSLRIVSFKVGKLTKEEEKKLVEVMESEDFVMIEDHESYHYRFVGKVEDKGRFKSQSHVVFSKLEGKVTDDRNFISNISTKGFDAKQFLKYQPTHML